MPPMPDILIGVLQKGLLMVLIGGAAGAFAVGIWMLIKPASFLRANAYLSKWISTRQAARPLTVPHKSESFVYRHHRLFGGAIIIGALYVLYFLTFQYDQRAILAAAGYRAPAAAWVAQTFAITLALGCVFGLIVAVYLFIRPSALKDFEVWANRWITARRATKVFDVMRAGPDRWVTRYPRLFAWALVAISLYILVRLSVFVG